MWQRKDLCLLIHPQTDQGCRTEQAQAHNFLGILELIVQKQDCHPFVKNSWPKEKYS